ncbi:putative secreted protein [Fusarium oxysporum f. sp. albedinis]|nr:putative secreted protein [Fusarium oxysporum f. sp. albedinis]
MDATVEEILVQGGDSIARRMAGGATNSASLMQIMLRAMLQETSAHLMSEQKKMLERHWDALMESQRTATQMMDDQLKMCRTVRA